MNITSKMKIVRTLSLIDAISAYILRFLLFPNQIYADYAIRQVNLQVANMQLSLLVIVGACLIIYITTQVWLFFNE